MTTPSPKLSPRLVDLIATLSALADRDHAAGQPGPAEIWDRTRFAVIGLAGELERAEAEVARLRRVAWEGREDKGCTASGPAPKVRRKARSK